MKTTFNVGLENNPKSINWIRLTFNKMFEQVEVQIHEGKYKGKPEKTLVIKVGQPKNNDSEFYQRLLDEMQQESIAYKTDTKGHLQWNENYQGERFSFDQDYFLAFVTENELKEKYHLTCDFEKVEFDEHKRPFYRDEHGLTYLSRKQKYNYVIKN